MRETAQAVVLSIVVFGGLIASCCRGADTLPTTEDLIRQLSSDSFSERERATALLKTRGPEALPALRKAASSRDVEVRRRIRELIPILEAVAALEPKRVTLKALRQPLAITLKEIEKQTGYPVILEKALEKECALEIKDVPFWETLERIREKTELMVSVQALEQGLSLQPNSVRSRLVAVMGSFRLEAIRFHEDRDVYFVEPGVDKDTPRRAHQLTLTVSVLAEPRLVLVTAGKPSVEVAVDEDKHSLIVPPAAERKLASTPVDLFDAFEKAEKVSYVDVFRKPFQYQVEILLQRSSRDARTVKHLRGVIPVQVMVARKLVVVTESFLQSQGTKCQIGDYLLQITRAEKDANGNIDVAVAVPKDRTGERHYWRDRIHLEDAKGNRYVATGHGSSTRGGRHEVSLSYNESKNGKVGPPTKLLIEDWTILHHAIPFEFKDMPLP